ncbi:conserved hypothetical protein [Theileria orientalis strain Shintoku]|uniref:Uncharacterized protein n=1 Tax=Theileria orientalis strain Shintoku TaxID=869250 RepID=J4D7T1_THEOR|nr:conserved hypothetical protein [Theileria orientalis strain Shintoku]BAM40335.1 conserved hypothetical protein [Theileria orientalis strain Shintoku]|eukprot:XP_009690636.1 conserved hypothetical protein [Theileria orientalis strain Shintoku]
MDWLTSLSPDSSDNEPSSEDKSNLKEEPPSKLFAKAVEKDESYSGRVPLTAPDSTLKSPKNEPKATLYRNKNLLSTADSESSTDNSTVDENISEDRSVDYSKQSLFSLVDSTRKINKFNKITIKSQELTESDIQQLTQTTSSKGSTSSIQGLAKSSDQSSHTLPSEYVEKVDFNEALESFNKSNLNMDKLTNKWIDSKMKIKEVKADDLLAGADRERLTKNPITTDDKKKFTLATKLMESDDGQVITTNVARRTQKRKHQINWLAMEAQDKEAEILERTAHMRKSKRETQMKYGW